MFKLKADYIDIALEDIPLFSKLVLKIPLPNRPGSSVVPGNISKLFKYLNFPFNFNSNASSTVAVKTPYSLIMFFISKNSFSIKSKEFFKFLTT